MGEENIMAAKKCSRCKKRGVMKITLPIYSFCSTDCAYEFAKAKQEKQQTKLIAKLKQSHKAERKAHREAKDRIKPKTKRLADLQTLVNKYVRMRDINDGCISCDKAVDWHGQWHAGHYFSRGHSSSLRFNLWNLHKQCSVCNNHLSGNIGEYTPRLIEKIGQVKFDYLVAHKSDVKSYDVEWITRAIKITRIKIKRMARQGD